MLYLFVALFFFFDAVLIHLLVCRRAKEEGLLLKLFILIAGINLVLCWAVFYFFLHAVQSSGSFWFVPLVWTSTLIYVLLIPSYLVFYFSTQQVSPSKKIMLLLNERDMTVKELGANFKDEDLIVPRLVDLCTTRCMVETNGRYRLTCSGLWTARVYVAYQWILGRKKGG